MREKGELDTQVYGQIKSNMNTVKMNAVQPRQFPSDADKMNYPEQALKSTNPLYQTSSMNYGGQKPQHQDQPTKYFPRPEAFTSTFLGGQFQDTGLNTYKTPSRVHTHYDQ